MIYSKGDIIRFEALTSPFDVGIVCSVNNPGNYVTATVLKDTATDSESTVPLNTDEGVKYVQCNMMRYIRKDGNDIFIGTVSDEEQETIDKALAYTFGLNTPENENKSAEQTDKCEEPHEDVSYAELGGEIIRYKAEADTYKEMYMALLDIVTGGKANGR